MSYRESKSLIRINSANYYATEFGINLSMGPGKDVSKRFFAEEESIYLPEGIIRLFVYALYKPLCPSKIVNTATWR